MFCCSHPPSFFTFCHFMTEKLLQIGPDFPLECFSLNSAQNENCDFAFWKPNKINEKNLNEFRCWPRSGTKNVIYFHSALLLTKTGFVQKTRPEITQFFWNPQKLEFSLNSLFFMQQFFRFFLAENRQNFSSKFWSLAGSWIPHNPTSEFQFLATQNSTNFYQKNSLIRKKWSAIFSVF